VLSAEQLEALRRLDSCLLANTIETFKERLRNTGFMDGTVSCRFPRFPAMAGYAATVLVRGSSPAFAGPAFRDRTDWWDYILSVPPPRVVVVQDSATRPGLGSLVGAVHMSILRALGCAGVVTNGSVRDIPAAEKAGFHLFSGSVTVSHAYVHIVEFGGPVEVGGLNVQSGDLVHGDLHGVQTAPQDLAAELPAAAAKLAAREQAIIDLCQSPDFSLAKLRAAVDEFGG